MDKIILNEVPYVCNFCYAGNDGNVYQIVFQKAIQGFKVQILVNNQVVQDKGINWIVPPDYIAARELIEIFLKSN